VGLKVLKVSRLQYIVNMISYGVDLAHLVFSAVLVFFKLSWNLFFLQLPQFTFQIIQLSFKAHHSNRRKLRRAGCHKPSNFTFHHLDIFVSGCFFETSEELVSLSRINLIIDKLSAAHKLLKVSLLLERLRFKWFCHFFIHFCLKIFSVIFQPTFSSVDPHLFNKLSLSVVGLASKCAWILPHIPRIDKWTASHTYTVASSVI